MHRFVSSFSLYSSNIMHPFKVIPFLVFICAGLLPAAYGQDSLLVNWQTSASKTDTNEYSIHLTGSIKAGWHLYVDKDSFDGLNGLSFSYNDSRINAGISESKGTFEMFTDPVFDGRKQKVATGKIDVSQSLKFPGEVAHAIRLKLNYEVADKENFIPEEQTFNIVLDSAMPAAVSRILIPSIDLKNPLANCGEVIEQKSKGLWGVFGLGFIGGLVALLLPCLFPMIPLTVSFFTKKSGSKKEGVKNAFLYGFFIFLIYVLLSLPFHLFESISPDILNNISTNVFLNVLFFIIFVFFAISFFGYFEITLPSGFGSKADSKSGAGNIIGIFFMALTLAIVSFSCTGPILGSLLAGALSGNGGAMRLTFGMGGFGLAIALPFALFALFPNWLNSLPKSGGWLNSVKVVLGFIELALAFKFLSNADLVKHWGILKREIFIGAWIFIGTILVLYLFGLIRFPHDSPIKKLSRGRIFIALVFASFTIYLLPGVTNTKAANLSLISGFPPPLYYSIYQQSSACILDLNCTHDYDEGLKLARAAHKPVLLDFTGYACVNCRRMEENVWTDPLVYKLMKDHFIVVSLYVDDKKNLPVEKQFIYKTRDGVDKEITTLGDKWSAFESENFNNNAQPLYAIISADEILMNNPVPYTRSPKAYLAWLRCGLVEFNERIR